MSSRRARLLPVWLLRTVAAAETAGKSRTGLKLASVQGNGLRHFSQDQVLARIGPEARPVCRRRGVQECGTDEGYLDKCFTIPYRDFGLHRSYDIISKRAVDRQAKTVSLSLHFVPKT